MPAFLFGRVGRCRIVPLLAGSISTRSLRPTSVTKTVRVVEEKVAQHVAFWLAIGVCERVLIEWSESERERMVAPKEASVARKVVLVVEVLVAFSGEWISLLGMTTLPNRTAVPRGEERISLVEGQDPRIWSTEMKPVRFLFTTGFPLTVVISADASALKNA